VRFVLFSNWIAPVNVIWGQERTIMSHSSVLQRE
jgi:hypothetical protein